MSRLFTCGFEESLAAGALTTVWATIGGATTMETTAPHSGAQHLRVPSGNLGVRKDLDAAVTSGTYYIRFYWYADVLPTSGTATSIFRASSGGSAEAFRVEIVQADSTIRVVNNINANSDVTTATVTVDTWYRFEIEYVINDTTGSITVKWFLGDETTEIDTLVLASQDTLNGTFRQLGFSNTANATGQTWFYDDIAVNLADASGFQDSWVGPGKTYLLAPDGDVSVQFTPTSGTNASNVDDVPGTPDDGTTQVSSATSGHIDRLTLTALGAEVPSDATIILAYVSGRVGGTGTSGTRQMRFKIWDEASSLTDGPTTALNDRSGWEKAGTNDTLVLNCSGKSKTDVASFNVGYENLQASDCLVTALWVNVEWLETPPSTGIVKRHLLLLGVGS